MKSNHEGPITTSTGQSSPEERHLLGCFNNIKHPIAVMSGKGGVGKSTVSALLAIALRQAGFEVGLLDADITGPSIPRAFGIKKQPPVTQFGMEPPTTTSGIKIISINLMLPQENEPIIWRGPLLAGAVKQFWEETDWRDLDYLVVDLPPGTGDIPLTVMQTIPLTGVVIVTSPQELATMVVTKSIKMAQKIGVPILGLVENMSSAVCTHCGAEFELFGTSRGEQLCRDLGLTWLGRLPWDTKLNRLMDEGRIEDYPLPTFNAIVNGIISSISKGGD